MSRQVILLTALLFVMVAQAAPNNQSTLIGGSAAPTPMSESHASDAGEAAHSGGNTGAKEAARGGGRYGIGFEARQGIGAGAQGSRGGRVERGGRGR